LLSNALGSPHVEAMLTSCFLAALLSIFVSLQDMFLLLFIPQAYLRLIEHKATIVEQHGLSGISKAMFEQK